MTSAPLTCGSGGIHGRRTTTTTTTTTTTMIEIYKTVCNISRYVILFTIYFTYRFCRLCIGACNVINKLIIESRQSTEYRAQQGRILWKQKLYDLDSTSPSDFLCFFNARVNPDSVLQPNVSLYVLTNKEAIFVETDEDVNIYSSKVHPFFCVAQFLYARSVIKMSIADFVELAERIGDPMVPVIWISNTGRCGGTMLCQIFESVPGTLVMHEPDPLTPSWHLQHRGSLHDSDYDAILKSTVRILSKPHQGSKMVCVKPRPQCTTVMKDVSRLVPNIRHLFMYRNSLDTIKSWTGMLRSDPFINTICSCANSERLSKIFPYFRKFQRYYVYQISKPKDVQEIPPDANTACLYAYMWIYLIFIARDAMSRDPNILPVKYEDIIARPKEAVTQLFDSLNIDRDHVDRAVTSMERDSQRDTELSRDKLASFKHISTVDRIRIDAILSQFNLPLVDAEFRI